MTENNHVTTVADTTSSRGAQWAGAGSLIALAAQSLFGGGLLGNLGGGLLGGCNAATQAANTVAALEMARKDSEIALLKAEVSTNDKLATVYAELRKMDKAQDATIAAIESRLSSIETAAPLREQIVLGKIGEVSTLATNGLATLGSQINCLATQVAGITKTVVPITAVCPQPMPQHNSWTAPTAAATA